jgi:anti-sigma factor RsiW
MTTTNLPCNDVREKLVAWLDGELTPADEDALKDHLAGCAECTQVYQEFVAVQGTAIAWRITDTAELIGEQYSAPYTEINATLLSTLQALQSELAAMRTEISGLRQEVGQLRRQLLVARAREATNTTPRSNSSPVSPRLPFAPPADSPTRFS